jgi:hypothetical protein
MSNTILTPTTVTREVGRILHNNLRFCRNINRQYDNSQKSTGQRDGGSIKLRLPNQYTTSTGAALDIQDTTEGSVTLTRGTQRHVDTNFTTDELTQSLDDFSERILKPCVTTLASNMDYDAMSMVTDIGNSVGTPGVTPATALVALQANAKMSDFATPVSQRYIGLDPNANAAMVNGLSGFFNASDKISSQYKAGVMGMNTLGYDEWFMTQSIRTHTNGTGAAASTLIDEPSGTLLVEGMTTVDMDAGGNALTIAKGDVFTIADVYAVNPETKQSTGSLLQLVCTALSTSDAGGQHLAVAFAPALYSSASDGLQNVDALPVNNAAVTTIGAASGIYPQNVAFHKDAFVLGTADLEMPQGVHFSAREVQDDISIRTVRQYRIGTDDIPCRFDVLYGYIVHRKEMACRIWG